ncbi:hypothetical protein TNCV_2903061 [Trichonephila clavipes]|nr:hypothetical protein TNCV_2903061 [Trichonephila clavipes]
MDVPERLFGVATVNASTAGSAVKELCATQAAELQRKNQFSSLRMYLRGPFHIAEDNGCPKGGCSVENVFEGATLRISVLIRFGSGARRLL